MEHACKAVAAVAAWCAPAFAVWATGNPWLAFTFLTSACATFAWFAPEAKNGGEAKKG